jgi:hypothetical protein
MLVVEPVAIARLPAERFERARECRDPDLRHAVRAKRDVVVADVLAARREQAMDALGLRRRRDVIAPQRIEQLHGRHSGSMPGANVSAERE